MVINFVEKSQTPIICRSGNPKWYMEYRYDNVHSVNDASISYQNFVNFGSITPELTELICELSVRHSQN